MLRNPFSSRPAHPLADVREVRRLVAELPLDNAFDAIDLVSGWLRSLQTANGLPLTALFDALRQFDDAAQQHLQRLAREYLNSPRQSKSEEGRLWASNHGYWVLLADLYGQCIETILDRPQDKAVESLKAALPLASARLIAAQAGQLKWLAYHYAPASEGLWRDLGRAYLLADALGYAEHPVLLYPQQSLHTSVLRQYLQALVLHASSIDCLTPPAIDLADRVIAHFLPDFVFSAESREDSVYWVDSATGISPARLARQPAEITMSMRFFSPGDAPKALAALITRVTHGELPEGLDFGRPSSARLLLPVLQHLTRYWATQPPLRTFPRHSVNNHCAVVHGFRDCQRTLIADATGESAEIWQVENVSFGGFGAEIDCSRSTWQKLGALLCIQPEGGQNWILCIVRRYGRTSDTQARAGLQSLSRQATGVKLHLHSSGMAAASGFPGIWLRDNEATDEMRFVLPPNSFNANQHLEFWPNDRRIVLAPIALEEIGNDFQIGVYRDASGNPP